MKTLKLTLIACLLVMGINAQEKTPTSFPEAVLNDAFLTLKGESTSFKSILEKHQGKTILIDVWASWCKDCIAGMPKVKVLQEQYKEVAFVFLSLDRNEESWKKGIEKYEVKGDHYFMHSGRKEGAFAIFLDLDWIPRYVVVSPEGKIALFKAVVADDEKLVEAIK